jgi:hypothetical protein
MKAFLVIVLCLGCLLAGYLAGHAKGHSLGARLELTSSMMFLSVARSRIEQGEYAPAVQAIDKGLDAASDTILNLEKPGAKLRTVGIPLKSGEWEKKITEMRTQLASAMVYQRSPVPEKMYQVLKLPVVSGNPTSSGGGNMPMIPAQEAGGPPAPAQAPSTAPAPAPKEMLPPGIERRQR